MAHAGESLLIPVAAGEFLDGAASLLFFKSRWRASFFPFGSDDSFRLENENGRFGLIPRRPSNFGNRSSA